MRQLKDFISESFGGDWRLITDIPWKPDSTFMFLYPGDSSYGFYTDDEIEKIEEDFGVDERDIKQILKLKPGECYTNDGENIYIRIKK